MKGVIGRRTCSSILIVKNGPVTVIFSPQKETLYPYKISGLSRLSEWGNSQFHLWSFICRKSQTCTVMSSDYGTHFSFYSGHI